MNYYANSSGELYHYGIKGMKWGIRRYQNKDGSLTPAGKKRARQEYNVDNKTAYELGKTATVYGHATARSAKRTAKYEARLDKKYAKDPYGVKGSTKRLRRKWDASSKSTLELAETYATFRNKAEQHCKSLIDKYGKDAVSAIKWKDVKTPKGNMSTMNERTNNLSDYALNGAMTIASFGAATMGAPIAILFTPRSTREKAMDLEYGTYYTNYRNSAKPNVTQTTAGKSTTTNNSTRVTGQEEADFWKAYAEEELKRQRG